jgi:hypothetical protein
MDEVEARMALIRQRYGSRLSSEQLDQIRKAVEGIVEGARALRKVRLDGSVEPFQPFAPYRSDA